MRSRALPRVEDFFPNTVRGHGTTHPLAKYKDSVVVRKAVPCVDDTCQLNHPKSNNLHQDKHENISTWKAEHWFKDDTPLERCYSRESAR